MSQTFPMQPRVIPLVAALWLVALPASAQTGPRPEDAPGGSSSNVTIGGLPALRQGDRGVTDGSPNVLINGRPVATEGSRTECGGIVVGGASNVFVNGKPVATTGSATPCPAR
jgi:uncharacterized Zn-binding protein involved in type VI secretion